MAVALGVISTRNASLSGGVCWQLVQVSCSPLLVFPPSGKSPAVVAPATYTFPFESAATPEAVAVAVTPAAEVPPISVENIIDAAPAVVGSSSATNASSSPVKG